VANISAKQLYKSSQGNDIWAYVIVHNAPTNSAVTSQGSNISEHLKLLLDLYADVFQDPQHLPPPRSYDHAIALQPGSVPDYQSTPDPITIPLSTRMRLRSRLNISWKLV